MASARPVGTNENISTYGSGVGRDYTALATWEAATDNNLVTGTVSEVLECYADSASYADTVTMAGATTNSTYFRIIRPEAGSMHTGVPGTGIHFTGTTNIVIVTEANFSLQDVSLTLTGNAAANRNATTVNAANVRHVGVMAKCTNAGAGTGNGINLFATAGSCFAVDCLAYECKTNGITIDPTTVGHYAYNCTSYGNAVGFNMNTGSATVALRNCLGAANTTADFNSDGAPTEDVQYCASDDATADDWAGTGNRIDQTFSFTNTAGDDYTLTTSDAGARNFGTDLSGDAAYPFDDDIVKTIRPQESVWDIGFFEVIPSGGFTPKPGNSTQFLQLLGVGT